MALYKVWFDGLNETEKDGRLVEALGPTYALEAVGNAIREKMDPNTTNCDLSATAVNVSTGVAHILRVCGELGLEFDVSQVQNIAPVKTKDTSDSLWDTVPTDGARNLDHYLYGAPKKL